MKHHSPLILSHDWGHLKIEDLQSDFKDAKLYPGGARPWNWRESGTRHDPGILPDDVEDLIERGAEILILSRGVFERLRVSPTTLEMLERRQIYYEVLSTADAIARYNDLVASGARVGALIHTTC